MLTANVFWLSIDRFDFWRLVEHNDDENKILMGGLQMMIKLATAVRNNHSGMAKLSREKREPIFLTGYGDGEMVLVSVELCEKREVIL